MNCAAAATDPELRGKLCRGGHGVGGHGRGRLGLGRPVRARGGRAVERCSDRREKLKVQQPFHLISTHFTHSFCTPFAVVLILLFDQIIGQLTKLLELNLGMYLIKIPTVYWSQLNECNKSFLTVSQTEQAHV